MSAETSCCFDGCTVQCSGGLVDVGLTVAHSHSVGLDKTSLFISSFISCRFEAITLTIFATCCSEAESHCELSSSTVDCAQRGRPQIASDNKITDRQTTANTQHQLDDMLTAARGGRCVRAGATHILE